MENQNNQRTEYNNLTKEELEFVASTILGFADDTYVLNQVGQTKSMMEAMDKRIIKNDKKIERLLKAIEYMDPTDENSKRVLIETIMSICLGLSFLGIEQMPAQNRPILGIAAGVIAHFGFRQFHDSTNQKILESLYKKLDEVAKENGTLKGYYKDLDAKITYFEEIKDGKYIVLS